MPYQKWSHHDCSSFSEAFWYTKTGMTEQRYRTYKFPSKAWRLLVEVSWNSAEISILEACSSSVSKKSVAEMLQHLCAFVVGPCQSLRDGNQWQTTKWYGEPMTFWLPETDDQQGPTTNPQKCYNISAIKWSEGVRLVRGHGNSLNFVWAARNEDERRAFNVNVAKIRRRVTDIIRKRQEMPTWRCMKMKCAIVIWYSQLLKSREANILGH